VEEETTAGDVRLGSLVGTGGACGVVAAVVVVGIGGVRACDVAAAVGVVRNGKHPEAAGADGGGYGEAIPRVIEKRDQMEAPAQNHTEDDPSH
jgi:hypothetical protein